MSEIREYRKGSYTITAEKVMAGTQVYNDLEDCHYVTSDAKCIVLTGTRGEQWPVTLAKLASTYTFEDGSSITEANLPSGRFVVKTIVSPDANTVFAEQVYEVIQVETSWGDILTANRPGIDHGEGDYIVYANEDGNPDLTNRWVVNGGVFSDTYVQV